MSLLDAVLPDRKAQLELSLDDIKWAIVRAKKLKVKQEVCNYIA